MNSNTIKLLEKTFEIRKEFFTETNKSAFRIFNGFIEGDDTLAVDLFGSTLLIHNYHKQYEENLEKIKLVADYYKGALDFLTAVIVKHRYAEDVFLKNGVYIFGQKGDTKIIEHGVNYSIDLTMNRDAGFYLDTRLLRKWILENSLKAKVLNTFAYTGSLGVAAQKGGAKRVVHLDLSKKFLNVAKQSTTINGFTIDRSNFIIGDFFPEIQKLKRKKRKFELAIIDPPIFSSGKKGTVDLQKNSSGIINLINKIRPLINNDGKIAVINNSIFTTGEDFENSLKALTEDGYVSIEQYIPVDTDFTGTPQTIVTPPPVSTAPFNHSTKIAILKIKHK
ncbi:MAG: class I SAM-dependent methyltransferase [Deltaproteobacteria bacterium]|nr:class I SAM-dependent methyltransferase [Deltaproteobacteria bacterium]